MAQTKLISVRVDENLLSKIDEYAKAATYLDRSTVINHLLKAMLECSIAGQVWKVLHCFDPFSEGIEITIQQKDKLRKC